MKLLALTIDFCIIAAVWVSSGRAKEPGAVRQVLKTSPW